ncbi:DUF5033 domain-containing protein [Bacteroides sp.]|uniref:DUF5033 domain-containing protein n=1 Tax=Bacteroides sp. TaxID=29523 RepID=UPI00261AF580|nr:DUF5033 domain-containing protein [Bacteroides sp.]MDD3038940.1 DUF5033 domain-containing protein [Bacteroides sp.]
MKSIKFFLACAFVLAFTACSNTESDSFEDNSSTFESMKTLYGIEAATLDSQSDNIPTVTAEEMRGVLEALYKNSDASYDCKVEDVEGYYGAGNNKKTVMMTAEYKARTRSGALLENFALCVSLKFNVDKSSVYYVGTSYDCVTDLFTWKGYAASISAIPEGGTVFTSTSYIYFRVSDEGNCLVKVPVSFKGSYDFDAAKGTYNFTLSKAAN